MIGTYEYASINQSPTILVMAGAEIVDARCKAVKFENGKVTLPAAGEIPAGILLISNEDKIVTGAEATIQIKDIGLWMAGAAVAYGDMLAVDAEGLCRPVAAGQYIFARALDVAEAKGDLIKVQIINAGFEKAASQGGN